MKTLLISVMTGCLAFILGSNTAFADSLRCQALLTEVPKNIDIKATMQAPNNIVRSPFCLVSGVIPQRLGSDGKFYSIQFELRLPNYWQGRFAYQFNEDRDGAVKPALGAITGLLPSQYAINQGFAVVSSNGGHEARAFPEMGLTHSAAFAHDDGGRRDYAYGAVKKLNPVARALVESYYQSPIKYAYGVGQSNGGRLAMVAATRFPTMFNGLLVGSPGFNAPKAALQHAWDVQTLHKVNDDISQALTKRDLDFFSRKVLSQCDSLDGVNDDMIFAIDACQAAFKPTSLICKSNLDRDCLALDKVAAIIKMFKGPHNSKNQALYTSWVYDSGIRSNNWRMWKVESGISRWSNESAGVVEGGLSLANMYTTPFTPIALDVYALKKYLLTFSFDKDANKIYARNKRFPNSSMFLMTPPDAAKPTLTPFKQNGGKMMVFHGNSDPVYSVKDTVRWYDFLDFGLAGSAPEFVKLYRIPGMPHGQGGASVDQFDMLKPLVDWVEKSEAPQEVIASARLDNPEITSRMVGVTRPLCPYPAYARYRGGDLKKAHSFYCQ